MAKTLIKNNKRQGDEVSNKSVATLVTFPNTIDSIRNFRNNIKAYGYLECMLSVFSDLEKAEGYEEMYHDIKYMVANNDLEELMTFHKIHKKMMGYAKSKRERTAINTFIICMLHKSNKELGLYNL
ncbi:hypothetical protein EJM73_06270 [Clostridium botulinum]|uniref:hypothetical protein n=1 Tax=Clostridium botulinum TaxID=1491 RepID=UPI001375F92C|nr:hypothetical protein [Clostridium botulinum]NCI20856.1 hypothetical protein [Clostridium botulinum]NCI35270.1 hypothetical protein [Clostridium botulinum]NCI72138.1 hypothetical protein [Clostridium botulinum]NDI38251.1 hypothetical protein [Clostridium botulinum]